MAKLTDRQKANIKAKWDTGEYTKTELSKAYKVSDVMIGKIVGKEKPANAHLVEAGVVYEKAKKLEKSSAEVVAIEQAVKHRLDKEFHEDNKRIKIYDTTSKILDKVNQALDKGQKQVVVKTKDYSKEHGSVESLDTVEVDLDSSDLKNMMDTVDKASITMNVNQRHANSNINLNQATQVKQEEKVLKVEFK